MLTTKRVITDDDRQGGYTTTVNRAAPVFNFDNRTPRADVSEYSEYETERLEEMRRRAPVSSRTEIPFADRTVRSYPEPRRRAYSEEDLMPSIQTMQTARTGRQGRVVAKKIEREPAETGKKALSQNAKLLIAVYAIIVFIALVLIIASGIAANREADKVADLEGGKAVLETQVSAQNETKAYFTVTVPADSYEPVNDADIKIFDVKPMSAAVVYKAQTNWFDKICDFFSRLAGGGK